MAKLSVIWHKLMRVGLHKASPLQPDPPVLMTKHNFLPNELSKNLGAAPK